MGQKSITKLLDEACPAWHPRGLGRHAQRPDTSWLAPSGVWLARFGCPGRPGWLDLAALVAPGRPGWLSRAKKRLAFRLSASMLPASMLPTLFLHASNLVFYTFLRHFRRSDARKLGRSDVRTPERPDAGTSGRSDVRTLGCLDARTLVEARTSGHPGIRAPILSLFSTSRRGAPSRPQPRTASP